MNKRRIFIAFIVLIFGVIFLPYAVFAASESMKWQEIPHSAYYYVYGPSELELGGREVAGDLIITVYDDGKMGVGRWAIDPDYPGDGYQWVEQIYDYNDKGFLVYYDSTGYGSVYYKYADEFVSDSTNLFKSGNSITADFYVNNDLKIRQRVTYVEGNAYLKIEYFIENISGGTLTDVRFFHGEDTYLLGGDEGAGFWDAVNTTIGVQKDDSSGTLQRMSLQSINPAPYAYESRYYNHVEDGIEEDGALQTNTSLPNCDDEDYDREDCHPVDTYEGTDNGYALEWRKASLGNGEIWSIAMYEKFAEIEFGSLIVTAPVVVNCDAGTSCSMSYSLQNPGGTPVEANLAVTNDQGWSSTITSPASPVTVNDGATESVNVQVTVPANTKDGESAEVTLTATNTGDPADSSSDIGTIVAVNPQPPEIESHNLINVNEYFNQVTVYFSEQMQDLLGDTDPDDVTNPDNYKLFQAGANKSYDFTSCVDADSGDDEFIAIGLVTYNDSSYVAQISVNEGVPLPQGSYRFMVCGTTSVVDQAGNPLNGGVDQVIDFTVETAAAAAAAAVGSGDIVGLPDTGFPPGLITSLPEQPLGLAYLYSDNLQLEIPAKGILADVVGIPLTNENWDVTWLGDNVGYLQGTAFPTHAGNSVLTGHSIDNFGAPGLFAELQTLKWGDEIIIHAWGQAYVYEVREVNNHVDPDNLDILDQEGDYPWMTLLTCIGYDESTGSYQGRVTVKAVQTQIR